MGRKQIELIIVAYLFSHDGKQGAQDLWIWEHFVRAVENLAARDEYANIFIDVGHR